MFWLASLGSPQTQRIIKLINQTGIEMDTALRRSPKPKSRPRPDRPFQRSQHHFLQIAVVGVYPTALGRVLIQESDSQARSSRNLVHPIIQSADDWSDHRSYRQQWTG